MAVQRIKLLGVPVDVMQPQELEEVIMGMLEKEGPKQIIFMTIWDFLRARGNNDYAKCVKDADLIIPVSKSILKGARFLNLPVPVRFNPFNVLINTLSSLENYYKSFYLLGGRKKTLMTAESNVRTTFPNLHIVGRYVGFYPKSVEGDIVSAIHKASPSLVLVSEGIKEKDLWIYNRKKQFGNSIFIYYRDAVGIFGGRKSRVKPKTFDKGLEIWDEIIKNPLKIFLIFPYLWYNTLLIWTKMFNR